MDFVRKKLGLFVLFLSVCMFSFCSCGVEENDLSQEQLDEQSKLPKESEMSDGEKVIESSAIPEETSGDPSEKPRDDAWKAAYKDYLLKFDKDSEESPVFSFEYIDRDDIPELVIILGNSHVGGNTLIVNYNNGSLSEAGRIGHYGFFLFEEKNNWIESDDLSRGCYYYNFATINNGKLEVVHSFYDNSDSDETQIYYEYNGQKLSKEEYNAKLQEVQAGRNMIRREHTDYFEITESNIDEQLARF